MISAIHQTAEEMRTAFYSECCTYRYMLKIVWDSNLPLMTVIGLNPSTATHLADDPTLRRVKGFAVSWGYGGVIMLNAFALRSTNPQNLFKHRDPVGPENTIDFIKSVAIDPVLAAWGGTIQARRYWTHWYRGHEITREIPSLMCFRITNKGHPEHPLYLPAVLKPIPFSYYEENRCAH